MHVPYDGRMGYTRATEVRRRARLHPVEVRRRRPKPSTFEHRKAARAYPERVVHAGDTPEPTPTQQRLSKWWKGVVEAKESEGWSRSRISEKSGLSRKDLYRWLNPAEAPKNPKVETLQRICDGLGLQYADVSEALGWTTPVSIGDLEGKIHRARLILRSKTLTEAQRDKFRAMLAGYERAYEGMLDEVIEEYERDIDPTR